MKIRHAACATTQNAEWIHLEVAVDAQEVFELHTSLDYQRFADDVVRGLHGDAWGAFWFPLRDHHTIRRLLRTAEQKAMRKRRIE